MTTQLSRERLEALANLQSLECMALPASHAESAQMARMLLAGMDSEPVGVRSRWKDEGNGAGSWLYFTMNRYDALASDPTRDCELLYAAPPAPAIPDHLELIDKGRLMMLERSHQTLLDYRADSAWYWQGDEDDQPEILSCPVIMSVETLRELLAKSAPPAPVAVPSFVPPVIEPDYEVIKGILPTANPDEYACCIAADMWNACRAAMLKAGPVAVKCPKCGDTGLADSGGVQPWGEPISVPCDCTITAAPEQD